MKKRLSLVCIAAALAAGWGADAPLAQGQLVAPQQFGDPVFEPDAFRSVGTDLNLGLPGRIWVSTSFADQGLGFEGSFATIGGKRRLFEDFLDGRWLGEVELHHSIEDDGGFFANFGVERVFSIDAAEADITAGFWVDYDGDEQGAFGSSFTQVAANASIKTRDWDIVGNGYFPIGTTDTSTSTASGSDFFFQNNIVLAPGFESALTGFDVTFQTRPRQLAFVNGTFEIGGYGYRSDTIDSFGGGRLRLGMQTQRGISIGVEVAHDARFNTTGLLSVGYVFGGRGGRNNEYSRLGRDLESTSRQDHIVRFGQEAILAIDPDTGVPYNVIHVDNTADLATADGTAENPFTTLAEAEAASMTDDVIFINQGDGTSTGLDTGIVLQDRQFLLGEGVNHIIPLAGGGFFEIQTDPGPVPTITNPNSASVIQLANSNRIGGITADGTGSTTNAIVGDQIIAPIILDSQAINANLDGLLLTNLIGNLEIRRSSFSNNGQDGINIDGTLSPEAIFFFENASALSNGRDGIHLNNYQATGITFVNSITSDNSRHGVFLEDSLAIGTQFSFLNHTSDGNSGFGALIERADGDLDILSANFTNNVAGGFRTEDFTNTVLGQSTLVSNLPDTLSVFAGNGLGNGAALEFELVTPGLVQDVFVTGQTITNGGRGILGRANGVGSVLGIDIIDNISISNSNTEAISLLADEGGLLNANIVNTVAPNLQLIENAEISGPAINIAATSINSGPVLSDINVLIENVDIVTAGSTAFADGVGISSIGFADADVSVLNSNISKSQVATSTSPTLPVLLGDAGINAFYQNFTAAPGLAPQEINTLFVQNTNIFNDNGIFVTTDSSNGDTFTDFILLDSEIRAVGAIVADGVRESNAPFVGFGGAQGVVITAMGTDGVVPGTGQNLTRVQVDNTTIRDFAGTLTGNSTFTAGGFNLIAFAQSAAALEVTSFGDANVLVSLTNNSFLNNGAGHDNDSDNDGLFNETAIGGEDPNNLLFQDAVRFNATEFSTISAFIDNNLFQDNFERGLALDTYQSATINAVVTNNVFENNDRGEDLNNNVPLSMPAVPLADDDLIDFEAINNEEFFQRAYESPFLLTAAGAIIDVAPMDGIPDAGTSLLAQLAAAGPFTANLNLDVSGNLFQNAAIIQNNAAFPNQFQLGVDGALNPNVLGLGSPNAAAAPIMLTPFGIADTPLSVQELIFTGNGFPAVPTAPLPPTF